MDSGPAQGRPEARSARRGASHAEQGREGGRAWGAGHAREGHVDLAKGRKPGVPPPASVSPAFTLESLTRLDEVRSLSCLAQGLAQSTGAWFSLRLLSGSACLSRRCSVRRTG